ncbi:MAG: hypothetical protein ABIP51_22830 [Bacteroidia bacterium]
MKKIIFILLLFTSIIYLKGQDSLNKLQLGVDLALGNNAIGKGNILPSITISKGKHVVFAGPTFIYGLTSNPYRPIYGLQAGYQFYPNGRKNRCNLFFEYDFNYMKARFQQDYYSNNSTGLKKRITEFSSLDNYLGFGFRLNIIKGLYFKTAVGLGIVIYDQSFKEEYYDGTSRSYSYGQSVYFGKFPPYYLRPFYDEYYFNYSQIIGIFKIGLGWDLYSFKKNTK